MKTNIVGDFVELHDIHTHNPILIRKNEIKTVYIYGKNDTTSLVVGNREFDVIEDYETVRAMVVDPAFISVEYDEEEKKRIEKYLKEINNIGCTSYSTLGMTDDEWHQAIAGFPKDN